MNDTKVQRYDLQGGAYDQHLAEVTNGDYITYADHARIVAEKDAKIKVLEDVIRVRCADLAKYQRLHAADVREALEYVDDFIARCNGDDRGSCSAVNVLRAALAMEALA